MNKVERVSRAIAAVISRREVGEQIRANQMPIKDAPRAIIDMTDYMWPQLEAEAKAAIDALETQEEDA